MQMAVHTATQIPGAQPAGQGIKEPLTRFKAIAAKSGWNTLRSQAGMRCIWGDGHHEENPAG
jgi:hypothetical protein